MRGLRFVLALCGIASAFVLVSGASAHSHATRHAVKRYILPTISDWHYLGNDATPPTEAACNAVGRRCFNPTAMANSYNYAVLHDAGHMGQGKTIAIFDSFGADTIRQDLGAFNTAFQLPHLCGETGPSNPSANCSSSTSPRFDIICPQGCPPPKPPPVTGNSNSQSTKSYPGSTYLEAHNLWDLEVALDVEWAHATAPLANIMLVTTPTAETLGVQGFQQMMNSEQYVIDNHMADVITQSFGAGEGSFHNGTAAIKQLRQAFVDAQNHNVTVFASSGDGGTTNPYKEPVKNPATIPYPSVIWPASDPLVTSVGGTYLCTNADDGMAVDPVSPPANCQSGANPLAQREIGWIDAGGGYSILFGRPDWQVFPAGSSYTGTSPGAPGPNSDMRGVPDVAYQASSRTGVLVRLTEPYPPGTNNTCGGANPCDPGWYVVGGTSAGSPQWAGILAMADEMAGRDLGFINPTLYTLAQTGESGAPGEPAAGDFYDVWYSDPPNNIGCNQTSSIPGYCDSKGWDAVTGLGSPDVAKLIPDLIAATP
jgi:subtilase family serine protease